MRRFHHSLYLTIAAIVCFLSSCRGGNHWTIDGRIEGAEGQVMLVEACDNGRWYPIDSVEVGEGGRFKVTHEAAPYPDIYRLRLGDRMLYFPIDSVETVTVMTHADAFDTGYTLEGSPSATRLMEVDRQLRQALATANGVEGLERDTLLKRELGRMLLGDPAGIVSYYIINKRIGGVSLFNPANKADLRLIGAVANAFHELRPNDPRTPYLRNLYSTNRRASAPSDTIYAPSVDSFEILLYDNRGKEQSLQALSENGHPVLLNFTAYAAEESPAFNRELNRLWAKYHSRGLEIYQVSLDEDEYLWRQAAANLPWTTVYNPPSNTRNIMNYNVTVLPAIFLLNAKGEVVERVEDLSQLDSAVARIMP